MVICFEGRPCSHDQSILKHLSRFVCLLNENIYHILSLIDCVGV